MVQELIPTEQERRVPSLDLGVVPELGVIPERMKAYCVFPGEHGEPEVSMKLSEVPVPQPGANEVIVLVMAAGINYNGVWAALGEPVSPFRFHGESEHIAGSDASGIVWQVGSEVRTWQPGDEVVIHCNQSCGQCPECNGLDPLACENQKIWGYETSWGSFAQFTKVQAQQLLPKPKHLSWEEAASYGLCYFTAYRMLVGRARIEAGQNVLVWGAAGGLGTMALQLCELYGANAIAVVSSDDKAALCYELGAKAVINRTGYNFGPPKDNSPEAAKLRTSEMRRFGAAIRKATGGSDPDIVFEHVGAATFATSVFVCKRFGAIVICGATAGYNLDFDVRYLWMRQKSIIGSHFANAYQANQANKLVMEKKIRPVLGQVFPFDQVPQAHQIMRHNQHAAKMAILVQAAAPGQGRS